VRRNIANTILESVGMPRGIGIISRHAVGDDDQADDHVAQGGIRGVQGCADDESESGAILNHAVHDDSEGECVPAERRRAAWP